ncbi:MAG: hypothetical protein ACFFFH_19425 [Candidatus Thorarchaeota archaeon]
MKRPIFYVLILILLFLALDNGCSYPRMIESTTEPDFTLIDTTITDVQPGSGVLHFNATV